MNLHNLLRNRIDQLRRVQMRHGVVVLRVEIDLEIFPVHAREQLQMPGRVEAGFGADQNIAIRSIVAHFLHEMGGVCQIRRRLNEAVVERRRVDQRCAQRRRCVDCFFDAGLGDLPFRVGLRSRHREKVRQICGYTGKRHVPTRLFFR